MNGFSASAFPCPPQRLRRIIVAAALLSGVGLIPALAFTPTEKGPLIRARILVVGSQGEFALDTGFYVAAGIGLLLGILGWGDQIRNLRQSTREQVDQFLSKHNIRWTDLSAVLKAPTTPRDHLARAQALLRVVGSESLRNEQGVAITKGLEELYDLKTELERHHSLRYWLMVALCGEMLLAGFHGLAVGDDALRVFETAYTLLLVTLVTATFGLTIWLGIREARFRRVLEEIEDLLRRSDDSAAAKV